MAAHTHSGTTASETQDHTHSGATGTVSANHGHAFSASTTGGGHTHQITLSGTAGVSGAGDTPARGYGGADPNFRTGGEADSPNYGSPQGTHVHNVSGTTGGIDTNHVHSFTTGGRVGTHNHTFTTDNGTGTATAVNNLQPYMVVNYIIKT
jgi:hypothetical protein